MNTVIKEIVQIYKGGRETDGQPKCVKERIVFSLFISPPHRSIFARRIFCSTTWTGIKLLRRSLFWRGRTITGRWNGQPWHCARRWYPTSYSLSWYRSRLFSSSITVSLRRSSRHQPDSSPHSSDLTFLQCLSSVWPSSSRGLSLYSLLSTLPFDPQNRISAFEISFIYFGYQQGWRRNSCI